MLGASENGEEWGRFLFRLEAAGVRGDQGLRLIIHDGGSGLCSALQIVHFDAAHQRCLFHKIRNIANAILLPTGLSRRQRTRQRKAIFKHFRAIWQAKRLRTALRRYRRVVRRFRTSQPDAVATLRRDFRYIIAFYRSLRTRLRPACALHSDQGLVAMISQQTHGFNAT